MHGFDSQMNSDTKFQSGDVIEITAGQFAGLKGTIEKVRAEQLTVMIDGMEDMPSTNPFKSSGGTRSVEFAIEVKRHQVKLLD